jgi:hypothetical protein
LTIHASSNAATKLRSFSSSAQSFLGGMDPAQVPRLSEFAIGHVMQPGYSLADSFEVGLDLVLEGLAQAAAETP